MWLKDSIPRASEIPCSEPDVFGSTGYHSVDDTPSIKVSAVTNVVNLISGATLIAGGTINRGFH